MAVETCMSVLYYMGVATPLVAFALFCYQQAATWFDDFRYPPSGNFVDVGGYKLHYHTSGAGSCCVVFDAGLSGTSLGWLLAQPEVAQFARVAGYAWSDPSALERTSANIAKELIHSWNAPRLRVHTFS